VEIDWTWQELEEKEDCEELAKVCYNCHTGTLPKRIITYIIIGHRCPEVRVQSHHRLERQLDKAVHGAIEDEG
jgi:hypothetical protein